MTVQMPTTEPPRFAFGENWKAFLTALDESRIEQAVESLEELLGVDSLEGTKFLDIGSGSGLFSLAAHRMGAEVVSFDYDVDSVACTNELKSRYGSESPNWQVCQGSVLDEAFMQSLGEFDVVYSWGVLHHTAEMTRAIEIAQRRVSDGGFLCIAIYNDQGGASRRWLKIKKFYNRLPKWLRPALVIKIAAWYELKFALARLSRGKNPLPFADWRAKKKDRGMSAWHDWVDWIGGLPFEVATPEEIILPLRNNDFVLENLKTVGNGWGCNEYVFRKL
ncbi:MAG: class I SAM-dependent methyltransferase [Pirellulaceae bacterium]|nr:class I SAM-dependent methyltransferase [Pirellulaceae bacterium]